MSGLPFKLHDFGARGTSSGESAEMGGMAHLVNFLGSDTIEAIVAARQYYGEFMAGFSIPAAEHSTITAWGREGEVAAYRNMLKQFAKPGKVLAVVSDSYDIDHACDALWGQELRQEVIDSGATVVIRPDSGDPLEVLPRIATLLADRFGCTLNSKGFKVLNHVRLIQGDGIDGPDSIHDILQKLKEHGFSADNIAFGMGGGLLQQVNRDNYGFAMKCCAAKVNGEWRDVFKDPITDPGKASLKGRLITVRDAGQLMTMRESEGRRWSDTGTGDAMQVVYMNGVGANWTTLAEVRESAAKAAGYL
jgi:nicotinamide phosphoribosyltransferase